MKKLILFSVLTVCVLCAHAQVSKLSEEVAMGDQQYLMGNIKEANKAYKRASKTKDLSAKSWHVIECGNCQRLQAVRVKVHT